MERDREPVRLVADALHHVQRLGPARQHDRLILVWDEQFLEALRQANHRDTVHAHLPHRLRRRGELALAPINDHQVRQIPRVLGRRARTCQRRRAVGLRRVVTGHWLRRQDRFNPLEPPPHDLRHRREVIGAHHGFYLEAPVLVVRRLAINKHNHARDRTRPLDVRVVVALNPVRHLGQRELFAQLIQCLLGLVGVRQPTHPHHVQRLLRVLARQLHQALFLAPLRDAHLHQRSPLLRKQLLDRLPLVRIVRDGRQLRDVLRAFVVLQQEVAQHRPVRFVRNALHHERVAPDHLRAPHKENLDARLIAVPRHPEHVQVFVLRRRNHLTLDRPFDRPKLVAQHGCALKLHLLGGIFHLLLQTPQHIVRLPLQEEQHLLDHLVVLLLRAEGRTRRDAALDVVVEARPRVPPGDLLRAGSPGEQLFRQVERVAHRSGARVRTEVARTVLLDAPRDVDPWPRVLHIDFQVGVSLVVLQANVEERLVALDQRRLQDQRFARVAHYDVLEVLNMAAQRNRLRFHPPRRAEVRAHPVLEFRCLAHVDHFAPGVAHDVHARTRGQGRQLLADLF